MVTEISKQCNKTEDEAISLEEVGFAYHRQDSSLLHVLEDTHFSIPYQQVVGLVGRNGAGKTTLLEILRGTLIPQKGKVKVGKLLVSTNGKLIKRSTAALISQNPSVGLAPTLTVYENFLIATEQKSNSLHWAYSKSTESACIKLLAKANMSLEDKCHEQVRFLSGGQQQALSILLALQSPDRILLLDEPTASLDPFVAKKIMDIATDEVRKVKGAILLVSHRLRDVVEICSRIIVLKNGVISNDIDCTTDGKITEQDLLAIMSESN